MGKKKNSIPFPRPKAPPVKKGEPHQPTPEAEQQHAPRPVVVNHPVRVPTGNRRGG